MNYRQNKIDLRLTDVELDFLNRNVRKTGMSREAYLRKLIYQIQPKESPPVELQDVLKNLRQINNNMNQIAVKANSLGFIDTREYWKCVRWLQEVIGELVEQYY